MAKYVVLANWTDQGIKNAKDTVTRSQQVSEAATAMGGSLDTILWALGRYDVVVIATFPDDETAAKFGVKVAAQGNVRTETLRAFTADEVAGIVG